MPSAWLKDGWKSFLDQNHEKIFQSQAGKPVILLTNNSA
jgi:hypothetical protein